MKYKILKDIRTLYAGTYLQTEDTDKGFSFNEAPAFTDTVNYLFSNHREEYFEEVKETPKRKWKIGDKVVVEVSGWKNRYGIIEGIMGVNYRSCGGENWMEEKFRDPTPEELSTYFR